MAENYLYLRFRRRVDRADSTGFSSQSDTAIPLDLTHSVPNTKLHHGSAGQIIAYGMKSAELHRVFFSLKEKVAAFLTSQTCNLDENGGFQVVIRWSIFL